MGERLIDDNSVIDFIDDNGETAFVDDSGNFTAEGALLANSLAAGHPTLGTPTLTVVNLRILPVGDSITQGQNVTYGSYRRELYSLLTADDIDIEFVGSLSDGDFPSPDHDGITGDNILGAWGRIATGEIIELYTPDIILLLIGTNDVWHELESVPTALGYYDSMLDSIATHGPDVKTLVGSLPPIDVSVAGATVSSNVDVFNAGLETLVASKGVNFFFVDINAGMTTSDLADGVHPTDAGNDVMAGIWYTGVLDALDESEESAVRTFHCRFVSA